MPPRKKVEPGKRAASEASPREGQFLQPVKPSTSKTSPLRRDSRPRHAAPDPADATPKAPRKRAAKAAKPASAPPARPASAPPAAPRRVGDGGAATRKARRNAAIHEQARDYANRQAFRATHSKPSITGRAIGGAAAGAAAGTAVNPGVGTAVGAVVGGAGGAIGGAHAKKAYKLATRTNGSARRIVVAEFAVCVVIAALSPLTDAKRDEPPGAWMKRMTAIMGLFFVLGLVSAAGRGASRVAAGFGGIVTVALVVSERDLFTKIAKIFGSKDDQTQPGPGPSFTKDQTPDGTVSQPIAANRVGRGD